MHVTVRWWHTVPLSKFNCFISPLIYSFVHLVSCLLNFCGHICGAVSWSLLCVVGLERGFFVTLCCLSVRSFSVTLQGHSWIHHPGQKDNNNLVTARRNIPSQGGTKILSGEALSKKHLFLLSLWVIWALAEVLQRNRTDRKYVDSWEENYYRNWLMRLQRLRSPMTCGLQTGEPGKPEV